MCAACLYVISLIPTNKQKNKLSFDNSNNRTTGNCGRGLLGVSKVANIKVAAVGHEVEYDGAVAFARVYWG